ncbi:MAG: anti-sigma factor [Rhodanobacter sp.]|nr:MAG: anti-sigma factor [Rhodanobacter sp.]
MNTPADDNNHLRYAEYVLGVLDADARAAVAHEVQTTEAAATAVALWQQRLMPLTEEVVEVEPAAYVWARIHHALQLNAPARGRPRQGLWNNLPLWHWLGIGASAAAIALLVVVTVPRTAPPAPTSTANPSYMAATIRQDNGVIGWTATMDPKNARMVVVPASPTAFASGRAPELWLIPPGGKPISVGMITPDQPTTLALDPALVAQLGPKAALAVSVEPIGGSPTGQPTGPVIAKGAISGVPEASAHPRKVASTGIGSGATTAMLNAPDTPGMQQKTATETDRRS